MPCETKGQVVAQLFRVRCERVLCVFSIFISFLFKGRNNHVVQVVVRIPLRLYWPFNQFNYVPISRHFYFFEKLCVDTSNQTSFRFYEAKAIGKTTAGPPVVLFFRRRSFFSLSHITPKKTRSSCFGLFATWPLINTHTKEEQGIISSSAYSDRQRVFTFRMANCGQEIFQIFLHINLDNNNMSFIEMGETCLSPKVVEIT